jgi:hypothetical protein
VGPANDVELVRKTLVGAPFSVDPARIVTLVGAGATAKRPAKVAASARPTRANIQRQFERLAEVVEPGDQVFVLFAGHGSQEPDNDGDEQDDGLDEIFLPADVEKWSGGAGHVPNAIRDDDIRDWLMKIRSRGAFVWAVFDACQSTTMTRGADVEKNRFVPAADLGIPASVMESTGRSRGAAGEANVIGLDAAAGDIAAFYAAQTVEPTPEKVLPPGSNQKDATVHGLFTYTLMSALQQAGLQQSAARLTYRDLIERVFRQYRAWGRSGPTPGYEGGGLDREVLGQKNFAGTLRIVLGDLSQNGVEVRAGALQGLTRGSILRVSAADARNGGKPLGHVRLTSVTATSSWAEPVSYGDLPAPDRNALKPGSYCDVAFYDYGDDVFKVAFFRDGASPVPPQLATSIDHALNDLSKQTNGRATRSGSVADANWVIRVTPSGNVVAAPVSGWRVDPDRPAGEDTQAPFLVAKADAANITEELTRVLTAVGRARNLIQLATASANHRADVGVDVELMRYKGERDEAGSVVAPDNGIRRLYEGDSVGFRVKNTGLAAVDLTLLFIDADYQIRVIYPEIGEEATAKLAPDQERHTRAGNVSPPTGWEHVIAIAVESAAIRQDFHALEQPALRRIAEEVQEQMRSGTKREGVTRGRDQAAGGSLPESPLGQLLKGAIDGRGATRGFDTRLGKHSLTLLTWRTETGR